MYKNCFIDISVKVKKDQNVTFDLNAIGKDGWGKSSIETVNC